jgi:hypothetical protein
VVFLASAASAAIADRVAVRLGRAGMLSAGAIVAAIGTALATGSSQLRAPALFVVGIEGLGIDWCWLVRYDAERLLGPARRKLALGLVVGTAALARCVVRSLSPS